MTEHANSPTLTATSLELFRRLAVGEETDPQEMSPLYTDNLNALPPALVVVPSLDPLADHGRAYTKRLHDAQTPAQLSEHHRAGHAFLSMPGLVTRAKTARTRTTQFLRERLTTGEQWPPPNSPKPTNSRDRGQRCARIVGCRK